MDQNCIRNSPETGFPMMSKDEFLVTVRQLSKIYDIVRAVDPGRQRVLLFHADGSIGYDLSHHCYDAWNKHERCENCISARAFHQKSRLSKFEFRDRAMFHVTTQYLHVDGRACVLEIVERDKDDALDGAFDPMEFVGRIKSFTSAVYTDSLTQIRNRRFFDDQLLSLDMDGLAMIDLDNFKAVNDSYGHLCGDEALKRAAQAIRQSVSEECSVVRFGGDEFVITFPSIPESVFRTQLEDICRQVDAIALPQHPEIHLSTSIGGVYGHGQVQELLPLADQEMYHAKEKKDIVSIRCYSPA